MKKKLSLNTIKVKSFITALDDKKSKEIKGGASYPNLCEATDETCNTDHTTCITLDDNKCLTLDANCVSGTGHVKCN